MQKTKHKMFRNVKKKKKLQIFLLFLLLFCIPSDGFLHSWVFKSYLPVYMFPVICQCMCSYYLTHYLRFNISLYPLQIYFRFKVINRFNKCDSQWLFYSSFLRTRDSYYYVHIQSISWWYWVLFSISQWNRKSPSSLQIWWWSKWSKWGYINMDIYVSTLLVGKSARNVDSVI